MFTKLFVPMLAVCGILTAGLSARSETITENRADLPRTSASSLRLIPAFGMSSFTNNGTPDLKHFSGSYTAGLLADLGSGYASFETGIVTLSAQTTADNGNASFHVGTWGVPLLAKFNFSGNPHETIFAKAGVMPFTFSGDGRSGFNIMGVGGLGGHIALGQNSSLLLDATYNRLFTRSGNLTNYQGFAMMAGLAFNI